MASEPPQLLALRAQPASTAEQSLEPSSLPSVQAFPLEEQLRLATAELRRSSSFLRAVSSAQEPVLPPEPALALERALQLAREPPVPHGAAPRRAARSS